MHHRVLFIAIMYAFATHCWASAIHHEVDYHDGMTMACSDTIEQASQTPPDTQSRQLAEVNIKGNKRKYSRKSNPAVDIISQVIKAKKKHDLHHHEFFSYDKYEGMVMAINEVSFDETNNQYNQVFPFLHNYIELHPITHKRILPFNVDEKVSHIYYSRQRDSEKTLIDGIRHEGINDIFKAGEVLDVLMEDCFTDIDIYEDNIRLFQYNFISPISSASAIRFYHYFLEDTVYVEQERCIKLDFSPANTHDFGFSGSLFITADSTWRIRQAELSIPGMSGVNFIDQMNTVLNFTTLPTGEQVLQQSKMILQMSLVDWMQKLHLERNVAYSQWSFSPIEEQVFDFPGEARVRENAEQYSEAEWQQHRQDMDKSALENVGNLKDEMLSKRWFQAMLWVFKTLTENYIETAISYKKTNKVDIGPVYSMFGSNWVEGRLYRLGAQTTANLNPHWFLKGWVKYGTRDQRWKGMGEATYSFNRKRYSADEFPIRKLAFTYINDVTAPSDKFRMTDKDNVFVSFQWTDVKHMNYFERFNLTYDYESENGLRFTSSLRRERNQPTGQLFYQPVAYLPLSDDYTTISTDDLSNQQKEIIFTEATIGLSYQPGAKYANTKHGRFLIHQDAPLVGLRHTAGIKHLLGGQYNYNLTELDLYRRLWLRSWGKLDLTAKGSIQWNSVPFPFLIMHAANLSYIYEPNTFSLVRNMEFLTDRNCTLFAKWDLNGKIFNRIPLIKRLKWRESVGVSLLWGTLTDKNNPALASSHTRQLFLFPGTFRDGLYQTMVHEMKGLQPYIEVNFGIRNILKFFHFEFIHRVNYHTLDCKKWGVRLIFETTF